MCGARDVGDVDHQHENLEKSTVLVFVRLCKQGKFEMLHGSMLSAVARMSPMEMEMDLRRSTIRIYKVDIGSANRTRAPRGGVQRLKLTQKTMWSI